MEKGRARRRGVLGAQRIGSRRRDAWGHREQMGQVQREPKIDD